MYSAPTPRDWDAYTPQYAAVGTAACLTLPSDPTPTNDRDEPSSPFVCRPSCSGAVPLSTPCRTTPMPARRPPSPTPQALGSMVRLAIIYLHIHLIDHRHAARRHARQRLGSARHAWYAWHPRRRSPQSVWGNPVLVWHAVLSLQLLREYGDASDVAMVSSCAAHAWQVPGVVVQGYDGRTAVCSPPVTPLHLTAHHHPRSRARLFASTTACARWYSPTARASRLQSRACRACVRSRRTRWVVSVHAAKAHTSYVLTGHHHRWTRQGPAGSRARHRQGGLCHQEGPFAAIHVDLPLTDRL